MIKMILLSTLLICACSTEEFNRGFSAAAVGGNAGIQSQQEQQRLDNQRTKSRQTNQHQKNVDYSCLNDCGTKYSYDFCQSKCSY